MPTVPAISFCIVESASKADFQTRLNKAFDILFGVMLKDQTSIVSNISKSNTVDNHGLTSIDTKEYTN